MSVRVLNHPLGDHLLTHLRDTRTPPEQFRRHAHTLGILLALEATKEVPTRQSSILTPLEPMESPELDADLAVVPILRAGLSMVEPFLTLFPRVAVGYLGLERDHDTAKASQYYAKLPPLADKTCFCLDPMLATGGSACRAIEVMKARGAQGITMVCVVSAPEGIEALTKAHPDVDLVTAAIDRGLNPVKYILPGLGDYGDRLYAT